MRNVPAIDSTGLHALRDVVSRTRRDGTLVLLSDVHAQPMAALERSALLGEELAEEDLFGNIDDALERRSSPSGTRAGRPPRVRRAHGGAEDRRRHPGPPG